MREGCIGCKYATVTECFTEAFIEEKSNYNEKGNYKGRKLEKEVLRIRVRLVRRV